MAIQLTIRPFFALELLADPLAGDTGFIAKFLISELLSTIGTRSYFRSFTDVGGIQDFNYRKRI